MLGVRASLNAHRAQSIQSVKLSLQSSELAPPAPSFASECCPPLGFKVGGTLACRIGGGGANSDEGTDTLVCGAVRMEPN
jgi:hypothetical protein